MRPGIACVARSRENLAGSRSVRLTVICRSSGCIARPRFEKLPAAARACVGKARSSIGRYLDFYNANRPHQSLDGGSKIRDHRPDAEFNIALGEPLE
jgi:hypothetical protein